MLLGPTVGLRTPTFAAATMNADELRMVYEKGPTPATILVTDSAGNIHGTYDILENGKETKFLVSPVSGQSTLSSITYFKIVSPHFDVPANIVINTSCVTTKPCSKKTPTII